MLKTILAAFAALALAACAHGGASADHGGGYSKTKEAPKADIVDTAASAGQFQTLLAAAQAAGLVETLKSPGPFTVFAPTDAAFAKLPAGTVETLLRPENREQLRAILTYHVVPGKVKSKDLAGKTVQPKTVQGGTLNVDGRNGVRVNNATVIQADIYTSNGVIHVIDTVLIPQ